MTKRLLFLLVCLMLTSLNGVADEVLIKEYENLRKTLTLKDPTRSTITRKLADLYFAQASEIEKNEILKTGFATSSKITDYRKNALKYYRDSLTGENGNFAPASGDLKVLIKFQVARLYNYLDDKNAAKKEFEEVFSISQTVPNVRKEAALALAEMAEEIGKFADADKYYVVALENCSSEDVCIYTQYRRAWNFFKIENVPLAIETMRLSLFDSKGQVRDQSLRDFVMFQSNLAGDGSKQLEEIEILANKISRPEIVNDLAEAFYAAGNKVAGTNALAFVTSKKKDLYLNVRLAEEFYGLRQWDRFKEYVDSFTTFSSTDLKNLDQAKASEVDKTLQRIVVQLDEERRARADVRPDLQKVIGFYLALYPNNGLRSKMIEGWLTVEDSKDKKISQLSVWASEESKLGNVESEKRWRKIRLSLAQEVTNNDVVIEEAKALESLYAGDVKEKRKYSYIYLQTLYKLHKTDEALPGLVALAELAPKLSEAPDEYAIKAQNIVLDIYNQKKFFQQIVVQAKKWTDRKDLADFKETAVEMGSLKKIQEQAQFEYAVSLGETKESLDVFSSYCRDGLVVDKSCPNAKVLAVKLKDQLALVDILERQNENESLINEYELMGEFVKAASLWEKMRLSNTSSVEDYLRVAMLYELGADFASRNKLLLKLSDKLKSQKEIKPEQEGIVYMSLNDAGLISAASLQLPWSPKLRMKIVLSLEGAGKGNDSTKKLLVQSEEITGKDWVKSKLTKVVELFQKQQKLSFYGNDSKRKFQQRLNAINAFVAEGKKVLPGADVRVRAYVLNLIASAYLTFSSEINATPMPDVLTEEEKMNYQVALAQMSEPFSQEADSYLKVFNEQLATVTVESEKQDINESLKLDVAQLAEKYKYNSTLANNTEKLDRSQINTELDKLKRNPGDVDALKRLQGFYEVNNITRLSSYYKGRLSDLGVNL